MKTKTITLEIPAGKDLTAQISDFLAQTIPNRSTVQHKQTAWDIQAFITRHKKPPKRLVGYTVTVEGYGAHSYNARSPGHAISLAWRCDAFESYTYREFLTIARAKRTEPRDVDGYEALRKHYPDCVIPEPGTRIEAEGHRGTVLEAFEPTSYVIFEADGKDGALHVHPASVKLEELRP